MFSELEETKRNVMDSINEKHQKLNDALSSLENIINSDPIEELEFTSSETPKSNYEDLFKEIDSILDELLED